MRECGDCTACCTALAVRELDKPRYQSCGHLAPGGGCVAYASRPGSCRDFRCLWLDGHLNETDRPDRLGVIFTATADPHHPDEGTLPMLVEVEDGALDQPSLRHAIAQMTGVRPVVIMRRTGPHVLGRACVNVNLTLRGGPLAA